MNLFPETHIKENEIINSIITMLTLTGQNYTYSNYVGNPTLGVYIDKYKFGKIIFHSGTKNLFISTENYEYLVNENKDYVKVLNEFYKLILEAV